MYQELTQLFVNDLRWSFGLMLTTSMIFSTWMMVSHFGVAPKRGSRLWRDVHEMSILLAAIYVFMGASLIAQAFFKGSAYPLFVFSMAALLFVEAVTLFYVAHRAGVMLEAREAYRQDKLRERIRNRLRKEIQTFHFPRTGVHP